MAYYNPATAESEEAHYLAVAADLVQLYAPTPDPPPTPDTYSPKAARAERLLLNWLTQTSGGVVSGESLSGVGSTSYSGEAKKVARQIVRDTMGDYYRGGAYTTTVASSFPAVTIV